MASFPHDDLIGVTENQHHNRSHDHSSSSDSTTLQPDLINFLNASDVIKGLIKINNESLSIEAVSPNTTIYLRVASGTDDRFRFTAYDGGANNKGRIIYYHNSGQSHFHTKEYYDTIYPAKSDYDTHIANSDAHHSESHDHTAGTLYPSTIGGATGYLSDILFSATSILSFGSGILTLEETDFVIEDGKYIRVYSDGNDKYVELKHDDTNMVLTNSSGIMRFITASGGAYNFEQGKPINVYSLGNDKQLVLQHNDTNASISVPNGDGKLRLEAYDDIQLKHSSGDVVIELLDSGDIIDARIKGNAGKLLLASTSGHEFYSGEFATLLMQIRTDKILQFYDSSAPGTPVEGMLRYEASDHTFKYYDGTDWQTLAVV